MHAPLTATARLVRGRLHLDCASAVHTYIGLTLFERREPTLTSTATGSSEARHRTYTPGQAAQGISMSNAQASLGRLHSPTVHAIPHHSVDGGLRPPWGRACGTAQAAACGSGIPEHCDTSRPATPNDTREDP